MPHSLRSVLAAAASLLAVGWSAVSLQSPANPGVRNGHSMAYDAARSRTILFGGADAARVLGDTWEWDGSVWKRVSQTGPEPRTFAAMAYDDVRRKIVLVGGNRVLFGSDPPAIDTYLADTWEWDGRGWTRAPVSGPPPRAEAAIAFDAGRGRMVLYGGYDRRDGAIRRLGDTWEWDGSRWAEIRAEGPAPRNGAAAAYDRRRSATVLVGGRAPQGASPETWTWNGERWKLLGDGSPDGIFNCALAYDAARGALVRFGGYRAKVRVGETWELAGASWTLVSSAGPSARNHAAMAYDARRERVVLYGGHDGERVFGDTWEWDGNSWRLRETSAPEAHVDNGH